ncbi:Heparan sulfate glucosamine 3-O-sulfotransferase [Chamberlinius hualienensis]
MKSGAKTVGVQSSDDVIFVPLHVINDVKPPCRLSISGTCLLSTIFLLLLGSYSLLTLVSENGRSRHVADDTVQPVVSNFRFENRSQPVVQMVVDSDSGAGAGRRVRFPKTKRRLPRCIVIGVRKCGTRALLEFLNLHPHVVKATQEVHFFDDDTKYSLGLEWYRRKMPYSFPDQLTVEKSPSYFVTRHAPRRIHAMNPHIKLLIIVRDPVIRTISDYTQIQANKAAKGKPYEPFETLAIRPETGEVNEEYKAVQISLYEHYISQWLEVFPRSQVHVVDGERLVVEPLAEVRLIEQFLGLQHLVHPENFYFNKTKGFFCLRNETTEKCLSETKGRKHPQVSQQVIEKLRQYFEPHNDQFFQLIGQRFNWSLNVV